MDFCCARFKGFDCNEEDCRVKIWDTSAGDQFRQLTRSYLRDADGVIFVFDVMDNESFQSVRDK